MGSDIFFVVGYASLCIGLFSAMRKGRSLRRALVFLFHATTVLVVVVTTAAHQYFQQTGTTLDYDIIAVFLPAPKELLPLFQGVPVFAWALLAAALFYVALGPSFAVRAAERWWGERPLERASGRPRSPSARLSGALTSGFGFRLAFAAYRHKPCGRQQVLCEGFFCQRGGDGV